MKIIKSVLILIIVSFSFYHLSGIETDTTVNKDTNVIVYKFNIHKEIGPAAWRVTKQSIKEAQLINANYILLHLNTYGGLVDAADSIRTKILNCPIPTIAYIDNNAASAGALISIACDYIYMRPGGSIGAATVVNQTGEPLPDKYQSFMRSTMRSTAETHGKDTIIEGNDTIIKWHRDPNIAQAMVDPSIRIPGIIDSGKVLTFTAQEALDNNFCEGLAETYSEVLELVGVRDYVIKEYKLTNLEALIGFLVNPALQGILIMIIIGGIYFELQSPGIGFPLAASVIAATLYFAPLYLEGLAENWEIIIFFVGLILIGIEVFVIPGFGVAGIVGIILAIVGLSLSMVDKIVWDREFGNIDEVLKSFFTVTISMFLSLFLSIYLSKKLFTSSGFKNLSLAAVQNKEDGYIGVTTNQFELKGKTGIAITVLRPSGKIEIEDQIYDAMSEIGFIDKGEKVKVIKYESGQVHVLKV
ncbi:nodulation protein NfeD [Bacteroidota bacterium]